MPPAPCNAERLGPKLPPVGGMELELLTHSGSEDWRLKRGRKAAATGAGRVANRGGAGARAAVVERWASVREKCRCVRVCLCMCMCTAYHRGVAEDWVGDWRVATPEPL